MNKLFLFICTTVLTLTFSCKKNDAGSNQPVINEISPLKGASPNHVTIRGMHFGSSPAGVEVKFGVDSAKILRINDTVIVVEVPYFGTSGPIEMNIHGRHVTSASSFTVLPGFWINNFETIAPGYEGRNELVAFSIGYKAYCGLGYNGIKSLSDLWEYDKNTNTWKQVASCPLDLYGATAMVANGKAYIVGGRSSSDSAHNSKEVWSYDPSIDAWQKKKDFPGVARHSAVGATFGGLLCYFGTGEDDNGNTLSDWWQYEPGSDYWVQKAYVPEATLVAAPAFVFNDKLYTGIGSYGRTKSWYSYDPVGDFWTKLADFPGNVVFGAAGFVLQQTGKGYVCGGGDECWMYDVNANTWAQQGFYGDRKAGCAFLIGEIGYFVGGSFTNKDMWSFIPAH